MKRIIAVLMLIASTGGAFAQSSATYLKLRVVDSIRLGDRTIRGFSTDATLADSADNILPTQSAVKAALNGLMGSLSDSLTSIDAAKIKTGIVSAARLGTGFPNNLTFLRGDGTWQSEITPGRVNASGYVKGQTLEVNGGKISVSGGNVNVENTTSWNALRLGATTGDYWLGSDATRIPTAVTFGGAEQLLTVNTATGKLGRTSGAGTVTSVGLAMPNIFQVINSPVSSSGTIQVSLMSQAMGKVFAGPTDGTAQPSFRSLVSADVPFLDAAHISSGIFPTQRLGSGTATNRTFLRGDGTWAAPASRRVTSSTILTIADRVVFVDAGIAAVSLTLPDASMCAGSEMIIRNIASSNVSVTGTSGQDIEGSATYAMPSANAAATFISDGLKWFLISVKN